MRDDIVSALNEELLTQPFVEDSDESAMLERGKRIAWGYSAVENSIAVLSDLKSDKSFIYNGGVAEKLGIASKNCVQNLDSIWEEEIFRRIHPDDLARKHALELQFFHLLKNIPTEKRPDYHIVSTLRMLDSSEEYVGIQHRMFYVCSCPAGSLWLALCLYNFSYVVGEHETSGMIVNSATGDTIMANSEKCRNILSAREKEILQLIERGKASREIAQQLSISKNTVSRHRQNILEKLRVKNSIEAYRIAKTMKLI